jgi:hypothetical protein
MTDSESKDIENKDEKNKTNIILPKANIKPKNPFAQPNSKNGKFGKGSVVSKPGNSWKKQ